MTITRMTLTPEEVAKWFSTVEPEKQRMPVVCELSPHLVAINRELEHAKAKHPKFANFAVIRCTESYAKKQLKTNRGVLSDNAKYENTSGIMVLECEVAEAVEAFSRKDYAATLDELAQCGAVVIRMMEAVKELMEGQEKAGKEPAK